MLQVTITGKPKISYKEHEPSSIQPNSEPGYTRALLKVPVVLQVNHPSLPQCSGL